MKKETSKLLEPFKPIKNVTEKDIERIVDEALARNSIVYGRLAEI